MSTVTTKTSKSEMTRAAIIGAALDIALAEGLDNIEQLDNWHMRVAADGSRVVPQPRTPPCRQIAVPTTPGLGVELDMVEVEKAHQLYLQHGLGARNDAMAMQYLIPGWKFNNKMPCMVR